MLTDRCAFSTGALYPFESEDALAMIGRAGFRHAELMPQAFSDVSDKTALAFEKTGVHIASIHYPLAMFAMLYTSHESMGKEGRAFSGDIVKFAKRMGTEVIVIHPTNFYPEDQRELLEKPVLENVRYLADLCLDAKITLAMENYPTGVGQYPDTLQSYVKSFNHPAIVAMVDTTEVREGGEDPVAFIAAIEPYPCHLHLSDFKDNRKHLPAGEGEFDWTAIAALLKAKGYPGYYTLEPSYKFYLTDLDAKLRSAYEFAQRTFG